MILLRNKDEYRLQLAPYLIGYTPITVECEYITILREYIIVKIDPKKYSHEFWKQFQSKHTSKYSKKAKFMLIGYHNGETIIKKEHCEFVEPSLSSDATGLIIFSISY